MISRLEKPQRGQVNTDSRTTASKIIALLREPWRESLRQWLP